MAPRQSPEYERAFAGRQLRDLLPILEEHGTQLWLPETHGRVDRHDPAHEALIMLLGAQSRRETLLRGLRPRNTSARDSA